MLSVDSPLLLARGLERRYGPLRVLRGVDVTVAAGEVLVVLGENGCGKSTLLRILAGLIRPSAGEVRIENRPVTSSDPVVRRTFGLVSHQEPGRRIRNRPAQSDGLDVARAPLL